MLVKIGISKLIVEMFIGVTEKERNSKQNILIDIECTTDALFCNIDDTVDYCIFESICKNLAATKSYDLLETFINDILSKVAEIKNIKSIKIKAGKPLAINNCKEAYIIVEKTL